MHDPTTPTRPHPNHISVSRRVPALSPVDNTDLTVHDVIPLTHHAHWGLLHETVASNLLYLKFLVPWIASDEFVMEIMKRDCYLSAAYLWHGHDSWDVQPEQGTVVVIDRSPNIYPLQSFLVPLVQLSILAHLRTPRQHC